MKRWRTPSTGILFSVFGIFIVTKSFSFSEAHVPESESCIKFSHGILNRIERSPSPEEPEADAQNNSQRNIVKHGTDPTQPATAPQQPTQTGNCGCSKRDEDYLENAIIPPLYTVYTIPWPADAFTAYNFTRETGFPFPVHLNMIIHNVQDIDEANQRIALELEMTMYWYDYKISKHVLGDDNATDYALNNLNEDFLKRIWKPDLIFEHTISVVQPKLVSKPVSLRFQQTDFDRVTKRNQFIFQYTTRLIVTLSCPMDFHFYPADTQLCPIKIRSFGYYTYSLRLHWVGAGFLDRSNENFDLQIKGPTNYTRKSLVGNTGQAFEIDILKIELLARRQLSYHMVQTYLPSIFFIIITWICFLVPAEMVEARIGISMTTLLTLTAMFSSVRESTPTVSYVKALDIWMVALIFFVFLTLLQFTVLVWLKNTRVKQKKKIERVGAKSSSHHQNINGIELGPIGSRKRRESRISQGSQFEKEVETMRSQVEKKKKFAKFLETYSFLMFFVIFTVFTVSYWSWLVFASEYTKWDVNSTFNPEFIE